MHTHIIRVYYEDTDAGGVVYYANYLKFAERARTEAVRQAGIDQPRLYAEEGFAFVVRKCEAEFIRPARLDDELTVSTEFLRLGGASIEVSQEIRRGEEICCKLIVKLGIIARDFTPARLPEQIREALGKLSSS